MKRPTNQELIEHCYKVMALEVKRGNYQSKIWWEHSIFLDYLEKETLPLPIENVCD